MTELTIANDVVRALPSIADIAQLRRRHSSYSSYRKNVCFITFNGSGNGFSYLNILNGFGGF